MPIHIIKFKLPEEQAEFDITNAASKMHSVLYEFSEWLRQRYKHSDPPNNMAFIEYEEIKKTFFEMLADNNIQLY